MYTYGSTSPDLDPQSHLLSPATQIERREKLNRDPNHAFAWNQSSCRAAQGCDAELKEQRAGAESAARSKYIVCSLRRTYSRNSDGNQQPLLTFGGTSSLSMSLPPPLVPFAIALLLSPRWREGQPPLAPLAAEVNEDSVEASSCCVPSSVPLRILELFPAAPPSGKLFLGLNASSLARLFSVRPPLPSALARWRVGGKGQDWNPMTGGQFHWKYICENPFAGQAYAVNTQQGQCCSPREVARFIFIY